MPRRASLVTLVIVPAIYLGMTAYFQFLVRRAPETWFPPMMQIPRATGGLINGGFLANATIQFVLILCGLFALCRFRAREIGLDLKKLPAAVGLTALVWAVNQFLLLVILPLTGHPIILNPDWTGPTLTWAAGDWLEQFVANTPLEETVFRGFLLPQCLLLILSGTPNARPGIAIAAALVTSQILFALLHVPFNSYQPQGQWLLLVQFTMGLLFAGVYLRTGNLFLAMGLHALVNNDSPLLKDPFPGPGLGGGMIGLATLLAVTIGPALGRCLKRLARANAPGLW